MHSKIINPLRDGKHVFDNKGSVAKTIAYLGHEAQEQGRANTFFNQSEEDISAEVVEAAMDSNTKGLRQQQEKFYSLVLSPSEKELRHISRDPLKLREYTVAVMQNYAANFQLSDGRQLTSDDVLWFATVHDERKLKQADGQHKKGTPKAGLHTHVHVIVSAKDRSKAVRLNPRGRKSSFSIRGWQTKNGESFQRMFQYEHPTQSERFTKTTVSPGQVQRQRTRIEEKIAYLNEHFLGNHKLDTQKVLAIGKKQHYGKEFFYNLHHLTQEYQQGKVVGDPYERLDPQQEKNRSSVYKQLQSFSYGIGEDIDGDYNEYKKRKPGKVRRASTLER